MQPGANACRALSISEIISVLLPHLTPVSFAALSVACKPFYSKTRALGMELVWFTRQRLELALVRAFESLSVAVILMDACDGGEICFTGGFLLAVLNGDAIESEADIDVMVWHHPGTDLFTPRPEWPYKCIERLFSQGLLATVNENDRRVHKVNADTQSYQTSSHLCAVIDFHVHGRKLQLLCMIGLDRATIAAHLRSFDYSFCRNSFGAGRLTVWSMRDVCARQCALDLDFSYIIRSKVLCPEHIYHSYAPSIYARLRKYKRRGYTISLTKKLAHPQDMVPFMQHDLTVDAQAAATRWIPDALEPVFRQYLVQHCIQTEAMRRAELAAHVWCAYWRDRIYPLH